MTSIRSAAFSAPCKEEMQKEMKSVLMKKFLWMMHCIHTRWAVPLQMTMNRIGDVFHQANGPDFVLLDQKPETWQKNVNDINPVSETYCNGERNQSKNSF